MALCRPHAVMAQMSLCGGTQEAPTWASQREQLGAEDDLSGKRACKDLQQPTHLAQHSSCQLCQASYLYRICPQPFSAHEPGPPAPRVSPLPSASLRTLVLCLSFFLPISHSFLRVLQEPSITSRAPACLAQLQAVPLQRCSLLQSWLSPPAAPTSHPPGECSKLCRASSTTTPLRHLH